MSEQVQHSDTQQRRIDELSEAMRKAAGLLAAAMDGIDPNGVPDAIRILLAALRGG